MASRRPSIGAITEIGPLSTSVNRWNIEARVLSKTSKSTFAKKQAGGGDGSVFSAVLIDSKGAQIMCKFWNNAADKWHENLNVSGVYSFSKGKIRLANKRYSGTIDHNYEIHFDNENCEISEVDSVDSKIIPAEAKINHSSLRSIELTTRSMPFAANVMGVVTAWQPERQVMVRGEPINVRNITIVDATGYSIDVAIWNETVDEDCLCNNHAVSLANIQVKEGNRGGKSITTGRGCEIKWNPATKEANELQTWYREKYDASQIKSISMDANPVTARDVKTLKIADLQDLSSTGALDDQNQLYKVHAFVTKFNHKSTQDDSFILTYQACSKCSRKMTVKDGEIGVCEKCDNAAAQTSTKLAVSCVLADETGNGFYVKAFTEAAQAIFNQTPAQIDKSTQENPASVDELCEYKALYQRYTFTIRARMDAYNNESRISFIAVSATPYSPTTITAKATAILLKFVPNIFNSQPAIKRATADSPARNISTEECRQDSTNDQGIEEAAAKRIKFQLEEPSHPETDHSKSNVFEAPQETSVSPQGEPLDQSDKSEVTPDLPTKTPKNVDSAKADVSLQENKENHLLGLASMDINKQAII